MEIYTHVNMGQKRPAADALESIMAELESDPTAPTFTVIPGSKKHTGEAERAARGAKRPRLHNGNGASDPASRAPNTAEASLLAPIARLENDLHQIRTSHLGTSTATLINAPSEQSFSQSSVHQARNPQLAACSSRVRPTTCGAIVTRM